MAGTTWTVFAKRTKIKSSKANENFDWLEGHHYPMNAGSTTTGVYDLGSDGARWRDLHLHRYAILHDDVKVDATKKLYLDGGGNSYIHEVGADQIDVVVGGNNAILIEDNAITFNASATSIMKIQDDGDVWVKATSKLFLDGGSNTYLQESSADVMDMVVAGDTRLEIHHGDGMLYVNSISVDISDGELSLDAGKKIYFDGNGGTSYIAETANDVVTIVANGSSIQVHDIDGTVYIGNANLAIPAASSFYFDGGGNTYIKEASGDVVYLYCGGSLVAIFQAGAIRPAGGDGAIDLGTGVSDDFGTIYYHSLSAHSFMSAKENITGSIPADLFGSLPGTGRFNYKGSDPDKKKYGFLIDDINKDASKLSYVNDKNGTLGISMHGLVAQMVECIRNLENRIKALEG